MARFDVYAGSGPGYLLDCQADQLGSFRTRFVVPLLPAESRSSQSRLHPVFQVRGDNVVMTTQLASAIPAADLGLRVASLADEHLTILSAFDMLISGY